MRETGPGLLPLALIGVPEERDSKADMPIAYVPKVPNGRSYRDVIERAVGWGRQ